MSKEAKVNIYLVTCFNAAQVCNDSKCESGHVWYGDSDYSVSVKAHIGTEPSFKVYRTKKEAKEKLALMRKLQFTILHVARITHYENVHPVTLKVLEGGE